jgi:TRAP-type mannitol/chloroaromatic compound transport system substrate-binding protein
LSPAGDRRWIAAKEVAHGPQIPYRSTRAQNPERPSCIGWLTKGGDRALRSISKGGFMLRRSLLRAVVAATAAVSLSIGTAHSQAPVRIRIQTAVPSASIYFELLKKMGDRVDKMSAGRVKMEMLPDGAVVAAFEILDAVDKGVVEGGYAWTHYWSGKNAAAGLFSNPMAGAGVGLDQLSHVAWIFEGGGYDLYRKLYKDVLKVNVEPIFVQPMGPDPLGWFKRPIASAEDFKKMKYRAPPGITGEIFKEMGVSAVALPGGEIVTSAQRGVIDAAEWIGPADDLNLGLQTIWKHYYLQGLHQSTDIGEIIINKSVWDKLSPDLQEIIRTAAMASMTETYTYNVYRNAQAIVKLRNEFKVEIHDTPKDFFPQFVRATNVVLDRYAAKDAFFKEVLDSQRNFAKTVVPSWTKILDLYSNLGNAALAAPPK